MWRKAMVYLGLGDDADYDEDNVEHSPDDDRSARRDGPPAAPVRQAEPAQPPSNVSAVTPVASSSSEASSGGGLRHISGPPADPRGSPSVGQTASPSRAGVRPRSQVVRPIAVTPNARPHLVVPSSFNQAQEVADKFKGNQPVVMNLQGSDRELSRRLIDFASGLCYGLGGQMERVANQVYLLTPTNVEVSADERRRMHERGYDA
ncbi:hypothetical protein BH23ACT2_BH23ACT2_08190 [soil metagenome]